MSMNNPWLGRPQSINPTFPSPPLPPTPDGRPTGPYLPRPPAPPPPTPSSPLGGAPGGPSGPVAGPSGPAGGAAAPSGRGKGRKVVAVVGAAALIAAGTFAVSKVVGNNAAGGAATPEDVGLQLIEALDGADVLGAIDLLLPGERETMREPMIEMFDHMRRLGVLADDASLSGIGGFELEFTDVQVVSEPTNVADIANVRMSGSVTTSIDGAQVPLGDLIIDDLLDGQRPDMSMEPTTDEFDDLGFTAVEQDGRWYLSLFHSIAESARDGRPVPDVGIAATGADSPEGAVDALLTAVQDLQLEALLGLLDPTELEAVQRYAPLFLADAQQALDDAGITWSVTNRAFSVSGSGSRRSVAIESLDFSASIEGVELSARFADDCVTIVVDGESTQSCAGDAAGDAGGLADELGLSDAEAGRRLVEAFEGTLSGFSGESPIAVHEVDGRWFVSPMRTGFDSLNGALAGIERSELTELIDSFEGILGLLPLGLGGGLDEPMLTDDGMGDFDADVDFGAYNACTALGDPAAAIGCLQAGMADGSVDPSVVPVPVRHPECGVAELYVLGAVYMMDDASFVAAVTAAQPCILGLVAAGTVDSFEVPYELIAPECLLGKNWYNDDDFTANEAFFACAEAVRQGL